MPDVSKALPNCPLCNAPARHNPQAQRSWDRAYSEITWTVVHFGVWFAGGMAVGAQFF